MKNKRLRLHIFLLLVFIVISVLSCEQKRELNQETFARPNIILINIDDLGWRDVSFMGSNFFETPHIDALSKKGMLFTDGYASAANCAPSRANLMTGQWPQRHGIYTVGNSDRGKTEDRKLIPTKNIVSLADSLLTLPEVLKDNGYTTCHAGKWHLTDNPTDNGFDFNIGGSHAGHPKSYYPPYKNVDLVAVKGIRLTDLIMDKTIDFIGSTNTPSFLTMPICCSYTNTTCKSTYR